MINTFSTSPLRPIYPFEQALAWADPIATLIVVNQLVGSLPDAQFLSNEINLGTWNGEYLWQFKAKYFAESYKVITKKYHLLAVQEISPAGLARIATSCGYNYFVSMPNKRGQAVGFLVHPRLKVQDVQEYRQLAHVYEIHDLRSALRIDLIDQQNMFKFSVITVHLKSMLGGIELTSPIRKKQLELLAANLINITDPVLIMGDFNCLLNQSLDTQPLLEIGLHLADISNDISTQTMGGRLDGLFHNLNPEQMLSHYNVANFWQQSLAGRSLSDHGLLSWKLQYIK